jgi:hypothetical protein
MASVSFTTWEAARTSLMDNGFKPGKWTGGKFTLEGQVDPNQIERFAKIAHFLSTEYLINNYMAYLSREIWLHYKSLPCNGSNLFSRALWLCAHKHGFKYSNSESAEHSEARAFQIKLIDADNGLGWLLRNKLFWKDSMHNYHGEYSHALQWLMIARRFNWASAAYSACANYAAKDKDGEYCPLWSWLADCFPTDRAPASPVFKNNETLHSDTFRSPQFITKSLLGEKPIKDHFISHHLWMRYTKRKWLADGHITGNSKGHALSKNETTHQWAAKANDKGQLPNPNRLWRSTDIVVPPSKDRPGAIKAKVKFHNSWGDMYLSFDEYKVLEETAMAWSADMK